MIAATIAAHGATAHDATAHVTVTSLSGAPAAASAATQLEAHETLADAIARIDDLGGGEIAFRSTLTGTIQLSSTLPAITAPTTITGPGATRLRVSGGGRASVGSIFTVDAATTVDGLTIEDGYAPYGGAIYADDSSLTIGDSVISGDRAAGNGGGIFMRDGEPGPGLSSSPYALTIEHSTISNNRALDESDDGSGDGGGVWTEWASLEIRDSTIAGNVADNHNGGIESFAGYGAEIVESTISGNHAPGAAGGAYLGGTTFAAGEQSVSIVDSTIAGNTGFSAGGLQVYGVAATLTADTITQNDATSDGEQTAGGLVLTRLTPKDFGNVLLHDTILADDSGGAAPDLILNNGATAVAGYSMIGDADGTGVTGDDGNIVGSTGHLADPDLGPLGAHGGPTETMLPKLASAVLDAGEAFDLGEDQRGDPRTVDLLTVPNAPGSDGTDMGAAELQRSDLSPVVVTGVIGDQRSTLSVPEPAACGTPTMAVPISWSTARIKRSHREKLKFKRVLLYTDAAREPGSSSMQASHSVQLLPKGRGWSVGTHHEKLTFVYTKTAERHRRTRTVKVTKSLVGPFRVCAAPPAPTP